MAQVLVKDNKYVDKYITVESLANMKVVSHGKSAQKVIKDAVKKGEKEPFVIYVPKENETCVY